MRRTRSLSVRSRCSGTHLLALDLVPFAGIAANGKTWKAHLDGYNFVPSLKGDVKKGPRGELVYFGQGG